MALILKCVSNPTASWHPVSTGDVVIIPPNAPHMYRNIEEPFRYLVIETP
jgi:quercetin dioxygenase-like cupin family protein